MQTSAVIPDTYTSAVSTLAEWYAEAHDVLGDLVIYVVPDPSERVVQLIEVSDSFPETGDLWPIKLRPTADFPFETSVLIATQNEWESVQKGALQIGANWDLSTIKKVWPRD